MMFSVPLFKNLKAPIFCIYFFSRTGSAKSAPVCVLYEFKVPVAHASLIAAMIQINVLLRKEKKEQSWLMVNDPTQKQLPSFGHETVLKKSNLRSLK